MIQHITYANDLMTKSAELCVNSAIEHGKCDDSIVLSDNGWDGSGLFNICQKTLKEERGAGYWLWKPIIIAEQMSLLEDGDYLVYTDAGVEFVNSIQHIIDKMDQDVFLFGNMYPHIEWCKSEVFHLFGIYNPIHHWKMRQVQASAMVIRVSNKSREIIREWLAYCMIPGMIDDSTYLLNQHSGFKEHRHDQAILTMVADRYRLDLHWWPACYNHGAFVYEKEPYKDDYPVIFHHHRKRNIEW
jgi:hypothetical protein